MTINQNRWQRSIYNFLSVNNRVAFGFAKLHGVGPGIFQFLYNEFRGFAHIGFVAAIGTDGRNAQQIKKLIKKALLIGLDIGFDHTIYFKRRSNLYSRSIP